MTRQDFIDGLVNLENEICDDTNSYKKALMDLSKAFVRLADLHYKQMIVFKRLVDAKSFPVEDLPERVSRPIAFTLPEELTEDELLALVCKTAADCAGELRQEREIMNWTNLKDNKGFLSYITDWFACSEKRDRAIQEERNK